MSAALLKMSSGAFHKNEQAATAEALRETSASLCNDRRFVQRVFDDQTWIRKPERVLFGMPRRLIAACLISALQARCFRTRPQHCNLEVQLTLRNSLMEFPHGCAVLKCSVGRVHFRPHPTIIDSEPHAAVMAPQIELRSLKFAETKYAK
jgi:hypothetical protein